MKRIAYYISDHGYGHAARSIAVIKKLVEENPDLEVTVNCSYPLQFAIDNLVGMERIKFRRVRNDFGYYTDENFDIDKEKTENRLKLCIGNIESYVNSESKFCKKRDIDLIISDISFKPFEVSDRNNIPSIGISNFTWWEVYKDLIGPVEEVSKIRDIYEKADLGLILPLETGSSPFTEKKEIGLVSRSPTRDYSQMRRNLGIGDNDLLVYFSHGKSINDNKDIDIGFKLGSPSNVKILTFKDNMLIDNPEFIIQDDEANVQDYIEASDIVVSKFGYSTVAEAIKSKKPMILTSREIIEDKAAIEKLRELKIAKDLKKDEFLSGKWIDEIGNVMEYKENYRSLPHRYKKDGIKDVITHINRFLH